MWAVHTAAAARDRADQPLGRRASALRPRGPLLCHAIPSGDLTPVCNSASHLLNESFRTQTARQLFRGVEKGQYHIHTSDFVVNVLLSSMSSTTPKLYPLPLELLMAPLLVLAQWAYRKVMDRIVSKARRTRQAQAS